MAAKRPKSFSRGKESSRSMVLQALEHKIKIERLRFYQRMGGWIGQVADARKGGSSMYKELWDRKCLQDKSQKKAQKQAIESYIYKKDTEGSDIADSQEACTEDADSGNGEDVDVEVLIAEKPRPVSPFKSLKEVQLELADQLTLWKTPEHSKAVSFNFHRPCNEKPPRFTSPMALIERLQKTIADKDKQIKVLRQQLFKIHKESSKLAEEIAGHSGPDAAHLRRQNHHLKDQLERCVKENTILRGFQMQSKNETIKRMQQKEAGHPHSTRSYPSVQRSCGQVRSRSARTCPSATFSHDESH